MKRLALGTLASPLLAWYDAVHGDRNMPWRRTADPYAIWVSEIMLQQTQVETVKPYYGRFLGRFPTVAALAAADLQEVLASWAGLGYYRRAKHLHAAARQIVAEHAGKVPGELALLRALPGIGRYTAGAIGSIAFGLPAPVVDGNVMRVLSRVMMYGEDIAQAKHQEFFWRAAGEIVQAAQGRHGDVNQALMELGATICVPIKPACGECPLRKTCQAHAARREMEFPVKSAKKLPSEGRLAAVVIFREARGGRKVLLMQRPMGGLWEGMWEFPVSAAGKKSVRNKAMERLLGMDFHDAKYVGILKHQLTHRTLFYEVISAYAGDAAPVLPICPGTDRPYAKARWVPWPLAAENGLPMATVVQKIAALARADEIDKPSPH